MSVMHLEEFKAKLRKVSRLSGYPVEIETAEMLYEELRHEERGDLLFAMKKVAYGGERPNLSSFLRHLNRHKARRLERQSLLEKERERAELEACLRGGDLGPEIRRFIESFGKEKGVP